MPPRKGGGKKGGKKLDPEQAKAAFEAYKTSDEGKQWDEILDCMTELPDIVGEVLYDLVDNWTKFFDILFVFMKNMKGLRMKSKAPYAQSILRTCFMELFQKEQGANFFVICNGHSYEIPQNVKISADHMKIAFCELYSQLKEKEEGMGMRDFDQTTFMGKNVKSNYFVAMKKDLMKKLEAFDKTFIKYTHKKVIQDKGGFNEFNKILLLELEPVEHLINANYMVHLQEELKSKGKPVPYFREKAVVEVFIQKVDSYCTLIKDFGEKEEQAAISGEPRKILDKYSNARVLLSKFKIPSWKEIVALEFFISKLEKRYRQVTKELIKMREDGIDTWQYVLYKNEILLRKIQKMLDKDTLNEILLGNEIKRDQIIFLYEVMKLIYESPIRKKLLALKENALLKEDVIPRLTVFKALINMANIQELRAIEAKKEAEQAALLPAKEQPTAQDPAQEEEEDKEIDKTFHTSPSLIQRQEEEQNKYGRYMIWKNYVNPTLDSKYDEAAHELRYINRHVQQDIEDAIVMKGVNRSTKEGQEEYKLLQEELKKEREEKLKSEKTAEFTKEEIKLEKLRPPYLWNLFPEEESEHKEHVVRIDADPTISYIDGRVQRFLDKLDLFTIDIKKYQEGDWDFLVENVNLIFLYQASQAGELI